VIIHLKIGEKVHTISEYIRVDQYWINSSRISAKYERGVKKIIQFVQLMRVEVAIKSSLDFHVSIV